MRVGSATGPNGWNTILQERSQSTDKKTNGINKLCPGFALRAATTLKLAEKKIQEEMSAKAKASGSKKDFSKFKFCVDSPAVRTDRQQKSICASGNSLTCKSGTPSKHTYGGAIDVGCTFQSNGSWKYDMKDVIDMAKILRSVYPKTGLYTPNQLSGSLFKSGQKDTITGATEKNSPLIDLFHIQMRQQDADMFGCPSKPSGPQVRDGNSAYPGFVNDQRVIDGTTDY